MSKTFGDDCDWRGTKIEPGQTVLYGAPVGRSIALVEAEVVGFTKSGRVNVKIIRRAYGGWSSDREIVHVGPDRLTVLNPGALPSTTLKTAEELKAESEALRLEREAREATHNLKPRPVAPDAANYSNVYARGQNTYSDAYRAWDIEMRAWWNRPCTRCNATYQEVSQKVCLGI